MITVNVYNQYLQRIDGRILKLQRLRNTFITKHRRNVLKSIHNRQTKDKQWFIKHFNQVYKKRNEFAFGTLNASLVIDCFTIYRNGGCYGYKSVSRIPIGLLIKLWSISFVYQGFPVVEYIKHNGNQHINYIKENQLLTKHFPYGEEAPFSDALQRILRRLNNIYEPTDNYRSIMEVLRENYYCKSMSYSAKKVHFFKNNFDRRSRFSIL